ncbi:MAG: hypothetical protein ACE5FS_02630 [Paracoccaceae bacterium]
MTTPIKTATLVRMTVSASVAAAVAACVGTPERAPGASRKTAPTQLEASIGLREGEYGRFPLNQLVLIKGLQESDDLTESEKQVRIAFIKASVLGSRY